MARPLQLVCPAATPVRKLREHFLGPAAAIVLVVVIVSFAVWLHCRAFRGRNPLVFQRSSEHFRTVAQVFNHAFVSQSRMLIITSNLGAR